MAVPPKPTTSETRAPKSRRLKMSRLRSSVPSRWPQAGAPFWGAAKFWKSGFGSGSRLAKMATRMIRPIQPLQIQKKTPSFFLPEPPRARQEDPVGAQGGGVLGQAGGELSHGRSSGRRW